MKRKTLTATLGIAVALGLAVSAFSPVRAASITINETLASVSSSAFAFVPRFDTSLGTLNFVQITYDVDISVDINFENSSALSQTMTVEPNVLRLFGHDPVSGGNAELAFQDIGQDLTIGPAQVFDVGVVFPRRESLEVGFTYSETFDSRGVTVGSSTENDFSTGAFAGFGNFEFFFNAALDNPLTIIGLQPTSIESPFVSGFVSVTYDFNDGTEEEEEVSTVPVPAALPLMIVALGAFGVMAGRRKSG